MLKNKKEVVNDLWPLLTIPLNAANLQKMEILSILGHHYLCLEKLPLEVVYQYSLVGLAVLQPTNYTVCFFVGISFDNEIQLTRALI